MVNPGQEDVNENFKDYEEETASHILCDCVALSRLRQVTFGQTKIELKDLKRKNINTTLKTIIKVLTS